MTTTQKAGAGQLLENLSFALELGLGLSFKAKQDVNRLITSHGGHISYMINRKVWRNNSPSSPSHSFSPKIPPNT